MPSRRSGGADYDRVLAVARQRLRQDPHQAVEDGEDVALSALNGLADAAAQGRFERLDDRSDLWRILAAITVKKALQRRRWYNRWKRSGRPTAADTVASPERPRRETRRDEHGLLARAVSKEPAPEFAAILREQIDHLLDVLPDPTLRQIAEWRLQGADQYRDRRKARPGRPYHRAQGRGHPVGLGEDRRRRPLSLRLESDGIEIFWLSMSRRRTNGKDRVRGEISKPGPFRARDRILPPCAGGAACDWESSLMVTFDRSRRLCPLDERTLFIDEQCDRYEAASCAAAAPRIEDFLRDVDGEPRVALWLELVMLDQELRRGRGESPTLADYRESCPDRMVWLELSTDALGPVKEPGSAAGEGTDAGRDGGTIGAERAVARVEPIADPEGSTAGSLDDATDSVGLPSTAGLPPGGDAEGVDGLALARPAPPSANLSCSGGLARAAWASSSRPGRSGSIASSRSR